MVTPAPPHLRQPAMVPGRLEAAGYGRHDACRYESGAMSRCAPGAGRRERAGGAWPGRSAEELAVLVLSGAGSAGALLTRTGHLTAMENVEVRRWGMNLFLDENFPRPALAQLQSAGRTAVHALEIISPDTADNDLFARAQLPN